MNISDPGPGIFFHPGSRIQMPDPGVKKAPDPGSGFFSMPDPGSRSRDQKSTGSGSGSATLENPRSVHGETRRAHFLRTHDMSETSRGWQQCLWVDMTEISGGWQQCLWVDMTEIS
jgi:hypothetical protein